MSNFTVTDAQAVFAAVRKEYQAVRQSFNLLLMGDHGTGKTWSMRTARRPVWIDSFDAGGSVSVRDCVEEGWMFVKRFEDENIYSPHVFRDWEAHFINLYNGGFFEHVGTYVLDSVTTWSEALLTEVMNATGRVPDRDRLYLDHRSNQRKGQLDKMPIPEQRDYMVQMKTMTQLLALMTALPCDFVCIAHMHKTQDEATGKMEYSPLITGKLAQRFPLFFDEVYVATADNAGNYFYQTQNDGKSPARSRLSNLGQLPERIKISDKSGIKSILKTVGYDHSDLTTHQKPQTTEV